MANLKQSDNPVPSQLFAEHVDPSNPPASHQRVFVDTDHLLKMIDSAGTVTTFAAGSLATDTLWDAAGDLVQGSGANTAAKLSAGSAGKVLTSNGAAAALTWETPAGAGAMATDALWDAAGDLAQGTGANTGAKLSAGTLGYHLRAGGAATAVAWASRELDYVAITSDVSLTATTEGTANTCITGTSQAYAAEPIIIEVFTPRVDTPTGGASRAVVVVVLEDSTVLGRIMVFQDPASGSQVTPGYGAIRRTPSAATHQYIVKAFVSAGTGTFGAGAGGTGVNVAAFLRITRAI